MKLIVPGCNRIHEAAGAIMYHSKCRLGSFWCQVESLGSAAVVAISKENLGYVAFGAKERITSTGTVSAAVCLRYEIPTV
jgi:hypothetical protein